MSTQRTHNSGLITLAVLNLVLAGAFAWGAYRIEGIAALARTAESEVLSAASESDRVLSLNRLLDETREDRATLEKAFVTPGSIVDFIESMESLARGAQVSLSLGSVEPDKTKDILRASLEAKGRFERVFSYIALLESMPPELSITKLSFGKTGAAPLEKDPNTWSAHADLEVTTFLNQKK